MTNLAELVVDAAMRLAMCVARGSGVRADHISVETFIVLHYPH
jgi:hypothetical protein